MKEDRIMDEDRTGKEGHRQPEGRGAGAGTLAEDLDRSGYRMSAELDAALRGDGDGFGDAAGTSATVASGSREGASSASPDVATAFGTGTAPASGADAAPASDEVDFLQAMNAYRQAKKEGDPARIAAAEAALQEVVRSELQAEESGDCPSRA